MMQISCAPLQGYTHVFYRAAHAATFNSFHHYYTPFFEFSASKGWDPDLLPELDPSLNEGLTVIPQVASNNSDFLIKSAKRFESMGFPIINLNMGCPFPMLVKRKKGGGLLAEPQLLNQVLAETYERHPGIRLSVKMRLGIQSEKDWHNIIPILNNYPLEELIVHPRTVNQTYKGEVQWNEFASIINQCTHAVTGNGDINTKDAFTVLSKRFPTIQTWMLGRGALNNPFLPEALNGLFRTQEEKKNVLYEFHQEYLRIVTANYPVWNHAFNLLKSFWIHPISGFENGNKHFKKIKKFLPEKEYYLWVNKVFNERWLL